MKDQLLRVLIMLFIVTLLFGCSQTSTSSSLLTPASVTTTLESSPTKPYVSGDTQLSVTILEDVEVRNGMRIELRQNDAAARIYEAQQTDSDQGTLYIADVKFEQQGENEVYLHFNVGDMHVMQRKLIEVEADE